MDEVRLDEWVQLVTIAMFNSDEDHLHIDVAYGGGLYSFYHHIEKIRPPIDPAKIMECQH